MRYLDSRILNTESEKSNENFKNGMISIIVTTNKRRQSINEKKLETLIKYKKEYICCAEDHSTNPENPPEVPENASITQCDQWCRYTDFSRYTDNQANQGGIC